MQTKRLLIAVFIVVSLVMTTGVSCADEHDEALKKAKTEDRPLLIYFFSYYCVYCAAMDKDVLADREISGSLRADTVYLRIDVDRRPDIARRYNVRGYPTTWLVEPSGKRIAGIPGYIPKNDFKKVLAYLKGRHYKQMSIWDFVRK